MIYFNVLRSLVEDEGYYVFYNCDEEILYEGFDLPKELDELLILSISGGECGKGQTLYFYCYNDFLK